MEAAVYCSVGFVTEAEVGLAEVEGLEAEPAVASGLAPGAVVTKEPAPGAEAAAAEVWTVAEPKVEAEVGSVRLPR